MRRALRLAALAEGQTSPNPLVGAVVLDSNGILVGEGFHLKAGLPHAEVGALRQAGSDALGGTLVVTLEPCCHQGRTPPCTEAVIAAGITRVVVALKDPDPRVSGEGLKRLSEAGIEIITGVLEIEASYQNRFFIHRVLNGRPWGTLKWAMSMDGRIALPNGFSKWISCDESRGWAHRLRANCDAVIVGGGTVRADDPLLTSRGQREPEPLRVVFSRTLDLPKKARLWDLSVAPTLIVHGPEVVRPKKLVDHVEHLEVPSSEPRELMKALALRNCNRVLWECGPTLAAAALKQGCVQELSVVIAPKLLGGSSARTPIGELGYRSMDQAMLLDLDSIELLSSDVLLSLLIK